MSKTTEMTGQIGRWGVTGIAILLGATMSVSAGAQQTAPSTAAPRATPCVTTTQSNGIVATGDTSATAKTAAATTTNGTPTGAGTTAGVAANPTPNNASTNPDKRLTGLNATNGANGVGADTTTTGKRTPPVAAQIPADSVRPGTPVCAPTTSGG